MDVTATVFDTWEQRPIHESTTTVLSSDNIMQPSSEAARRGGVSDRFTMTLNAGALP